jgi:predicted dehydrogenase
MTKCRLVLMGAGLIGREHAALISAHEGAELVGLADPMSAGRDYASSIGVTHFNDYIAMLDATKPDGAIIALPNHLHEPAALACIKRGIASLVEKPIADELESAHRLVLASEKADVPILVGHHRRHSPDIHEARNIVADGLLGDLVAVNGMALYDKPDSYFDVEWRRREGGGPLLINIIHDIDCLRYICGEIESVRAFTSNAVRKFEVEDTASVALRFTSGVLGTFVISDAAASPWAWEFTSGQALYFPHQPGAYLFLAGRKGALSVSDMHLWRHTSADGNWQTPFAREDRTPDKSRAYVNQLDHFLDVIARRAKPIISARDGMMTLAATIAVGASAREDRTIAVADLVRFDRQAGSGPGSCEHG